MRQDDEARAAYTAGFELDDDRRPLDEALFAAKTKYFAARRDTGRFVEHHLDLIKSAAASTVVATTPAPRIYCYWGQGFAAAPAIVRFCYQQHRRLHDRGELVALDATMVDLATSIPPAVRRISSRRPAHFSDYVRVALLERYGGVWSDATCLPTRPLTDEFERLVGDSGFFAFRHNPGPDISNWFLAAEAGSYIASMMRAALTVFWEQHGKPAHYHFFHHIFEALYHLDGPFSGLWDAAPTPPDKPRALNRAMYDSYDPDRLQTILAGSFVHKLTHKLNRRKLTPDSMISRLVLDGAVVLDNNL